MLRVTTLLLAMGISASAHSTFTLPTSGCPMAHCSSFAGHQDPLAPPTVPPTMNQNFADPEAGRSLGLGCVSNNTFVACTYGTGPLRDSSNNRYCPSGAVGANPKDTLVIYSATGSVLYTSNCLFDSTAQTSVPMMNTNGDVIMTDDHSIVRINYNSSTHSYPSTGGYSLCTRITPATPVACSSSPGTLLDPLPGSPISPILLANNTMVAFATNAPGYVFAFWADDLTLIGRTTYSGECDLPGGTCPYQTTNTPAASYTAPNRFYVSMGAYNETDNTSDDGYGFLVAFEANSGAGTIDTIWSYQFGSPSGASPVVLPVAGGSNSAIIFDGSGATKGTSTDPRLIKIYDTGSTYLWKWNSTSGDFNNRIPASVTVDNLNDRNCAWAYAVGSQTLKCVSLTNTYHVDNYFSVGTFVSATFPASAVSITHPSTGGQVLVLSVNYVGTTAGRILAVQVTGDYSTSNFAAADYWDFGLPNMGEFAPTQFPIVTASGYPAIAFPSNKNRLYLYSNR